jgi:hypothetical protein
MQRCYEIFKTGDPQQRADAVYLLRDIADERVLSWVPEFLADETPDVQNWGISVLDQLCFHPSIGKEEAEPLIRRAVVHPNEHVREQAHRVARRLEWEEGEVTMGRRLSAMLAALGYAPQWLAFGFVDEQRVEEQFGSLMQTVDTGRHRHESFRAFLSGRYSLTDQEIDRYVVLVEADPDEIIEQSALVDLLLWPHLSVEQSRWLWHDTNIDLYLVWDKIDAERPQLVQDLVAGEIPAEEVRSLVRGGSALVQHMLLEYAGLSKEDLEFLEREGKDEGVRNLAAGIARNGI